MRIFHKPTLEQAIKQQIPDLNQEQLQTIKESYRAFIEKLNNASNSQVKLNPDKVYEEFLNSVVKNYDSHRIKTAFTGENENAGASLGDDNYDRMNTGSFARPPVSENTSSTQFRN